MTYDAEARCSALSYLVVLVAICLVIALSQPAAVAGRRGRFAGRPLAEALEALRAEGLNILYSSDLIRPGATVRVEPESGDPRAMLEEILLPHGLDIETGPGDLLIVVAAPHRGEVRGRVWDRRTGRPLSGVRVTVPGTGIVAETDRAGRFVLERVPVGEHVIETEHDRYSPQRTEAVPVKTGRVTRLDIEMALPRYMEDTVLVTARGQEARRDGPAPSDTLGETAIRGIPDPHHDLMRVVGTLPGAVGRDESAALNVRGGADDEALVILDGLELHDPFHLKDYQGLVSFVDSRIVDSVAIFSDAFPVEFGGSMSAVIEIDTLEPDDETRTSVGIGTEDAHVRSGGGHREGRAQWLVSGRGGFPRELDALERYGTESGLRPSYFDFFAKTSHRIGTKSTVSLHLLGTYDDVDGSRSDGTRFNSKSDDRYLWLALSNAWTPRIYSRTLLSIGDKERDRSGSEEQTTVSDQRSTELTGFKQEWIFGQFGRHRVKAGVDVRKLRASYVYRTTSPDPVGSDPSATVISMSELSPDGTEIGVFVANRIRLRPRLTLELGLRWDRQGYVDGANHDISPRLHLLYRPTDRGTIRLSLGDLYQPQPIDALQVEDGLESYFPAQHAEHQSIQFEQRLSERTYLRVSAYRKKMTDLHPRFENLFNPLHLIPEIADDRVRIDPDGAEARGMELFARHTTARGFESWLAYAAATAEDEVDGSNVARSWDQRHTAGVGLAFRNARWLIAWMASYHSGRPTTPVTAEAITQPDGSVTIVPVLGSRNSARLPSADSMALRLQRMWKVRSSDLSLHVDVANLANSRNICCIESFSFDPQPDGSIAVTPHEITVQPREIRAGVRWSF